MKVKFTESAKNDLDELRSWYYEINPKLVIKLNKELKTKLSRVKSNPEIYTIKYKELRSFKINRFPYLLYYKVVGELLYVVAIIHTKRDISKILN